MSVENDNLVREFKKGVKFSSTDSSSCKKFMNGKLESAIYKMKQKGATDPDGIPSTFLKLLAKLLLKNPSASSTNYFYILSVNESSIWLLSPQSLKQPSNVASYEPISLTSCIMKLLECIPADNLYYIVETIHFFSHFQ